MLYLRTFGGLSLENGGRPIYGAGGQRARLAILAVLAVGGESGVSRDKILALFWPESDVERGRGALKQALYAMRRDLAERELALGTSDLRLNPQVITSDVTEFEHALAAGNLEAAVALNAGIFLDGIHLRNAPEFERWLDRERERLAQAYRDALEALARAAERSAEPSSAVPWWRKLAVTDPHNARVARAYMQALVASGDREAAIRHGRAYAELIRDELGAEPDDALLELVEQLRASARNGPVVNAGIVRSSAIASEASPPAPAFAAAPADPMPRKSSAARIAGSVAVAAAIVAVSVAALLSPKSEADLAVVPPFVNETGDTSFDVVGEMMADWVSQGLAQTGLVEVVDSRTALRSVSDSLNRSRRWDESASAATRQMVSRRTGANILVRGVVYRQRDSLTIQTQIVAVNDGKVLFQAGPVAGPAGDPRSIAEGVRQRVMGAFAAFADKRFAAWERAVSQPPRHDAYVEFVNGLELSAQTRHAEAYLHFINAARLDTEFVQAKLYALSTGWYAGDSLRFNADSLRRAAIAQRSRLTPYDRLSLDRSIVEGRDRESAYRLSRRLVQLAPRSAEAALFLAKDAVLTNRFREAIDVLNRIGEDRGWLDNALLFLYWESWAHHLAGDFEGEIAAGKRAVARRPDVAAFCVREVTPLAALGREASVDSIVARCRTLPNPPPVGAPLMRAGIEYHAHGHEAAARRALLRARAWYAEHMPGRSDALIIIDWHLGDWRRVLEYWRAESLKHPLDARGSAQVGVASAHLGDRATAVSMSNRLDSLILASERSGNTTAWWYGLVWRSTVAAALGNREHALRLLNEAARRGGTLPLSFHDQPGLDPLRDSKAFANLFRDRS